MPLSTPYNLSTPIFPNLFPKITRELKVSVNLCSGRSFKWSRLVRGVRLTGVGNPQGVGRRDHVTDTCSEASKKI